MTVGKNIKVFKIGGSALDSQEAAESFFNGLRCKVVPGETVFIHGGGGEISRWMKRFGCEAGFVDGQRVTDEEAICVVEMVLSGLVNKRIVSILLNMDFKAVGLSGRDGMVLARKLDEKLGFVGEVSKVRSDLIRRFLDEEIIPVISPVSHDISGKALNVNADFFAAAVAVAVDASEFNIATATGGVLKDGDMLDKIEVSEIPLLIEEGVVTDGMIPKLQAALAARKGNVGVVRMIDYKGKGGTEIL